jgi:hypothetical protein
MLVPVAFHVTEEEKETVPPGQTVVGDAVNDTVGGVLTVMYPVLVIVFFPEALLTVRLTVYVPGVE